MVAIYLWLLHPYTQFYDHVFEHVFITKRRYNEKSFEINEEIEKGYRSEWEFSRALAVGEGTPLTRIVNS